MILVIAIFACAFPRGEQTVSDNVIQTAIAETRTAEASGGMIKEATNAPGEIGEIETLFPVAATLTAMAGGGNEAEQPSMINTVSVGAWEIALDGIDYVADFNGKLPEEGHEFHAINIQVLNRSDRPQFFSPGVLGSFKTVWGDFSYHSIGFDSLEGYIPPGWPIKAKIILDIPSIVDNPIYILQPKGSFDTADQIELNNLGSNLVYEKPLTKKLGDVFSLPGVAEITPNDVRTLEFNYGNYHDNQILLLDSSIKNLYGQDITIGYDTKLIFQLFSAGRIIPITRIGYEYNSPGEYPNYFTIWYSTQLESISSPNDIPNMEPIAPGIVREGSFWLNNWGQSLPPNDMVLLIMHETPVGYSSQISDWALYKLSDDAASLLDYPIAKPEIENIALIEAQRLIDDGNWAAAAVVLGNAKLNNPGNIEISTKLEDVQQKTGQLLFTDRDKLISRRLGSNINETNTFFEFREREGYRSYDTFVSPDGRNVLVIDYQDHNNITLIDKNQGQKNHLVVADSFEYGVDRRFLSWSTSNDKFILLDESVINMQNFVIVNTINNSIEVVNVCEDAPVKGLVAWSPNEDRIAYYGYSHRGFIMVMNLNTNQCTYIHEFEDGMRMDWWSPKIGWSSDGNFIYFGFENQLVRSSLIDPNIEPLTPFYYENVEHIYMGFDGRNLIFDVFVGDTYLFDTKTNQVYRIENDIDTFELRNWVP